MDWILHNARVWMGGDRFCEALAVRDGCIAAVGTDGQVLPLRQPGSRIVDLQGALVIPGFNDAHLHLMEGGFHLLGVDLRPARDRGDFCRRLQDKARTLPKGSWITGGFWDHERWPDKKLPDRRLIDQAVPDHPVFVVRVDWHIGVANSLALRLAGISAGTAAPEGGVIDRDPVTGETTGILRDSAHRLISAVIPAPDRAQSTAALGAAMDHASQRGVTSIQGACSDEDLSLYREMESHGELQLRMSCWHNIADRHAADTLDPADVMDWPFLRAGIAKLFVDGSFGATTALLSEPYESEPGQCGLAIHERGELLEIARRIHCAGRPMAIHAIGDLAVTWALDAIEAAQATDSASLRHRIEHAQMVRDDDLPRFKRSGIIASLQPSHAIDDMRWIEKRIGRRARLAYRFRSLLEAGTAVAIGTDWTVEPMDPMLTLYAAVTREFPEGGPSGGWQPQEKVTLIEALTAYTAGSAYAEQREGVKGMLQPGYWADLTVLSDDIFSLPAEKWLTTTATATMVDGRMVWDGLKRFG